MALSKFYMHTLSHPAISFLEIWPTDRFAQSIYRLFVAAFLKIAKDWKQLTCPCDLKYRLNKTQTTRAVEYYAADKTKKALYVLLQEDRCGVR